MQNDKQYIIILSQYVSVFLPPETLESQGPLALTEKRGKQAGPRPSSTPPPKRSETNERLDSVLQEAIDELRELNGHQTDQFLSSIMKRKRKARRFRIRYIQGLTNTNFPSPSDFRDRNKYFQFNIVSQIIFRFQLIRINH